MFNFSNNKEVLSLNTFDDVWKDFVPFQSVTYTQSFLHRCYEQSNESDALAKSYKNSYPMSYYLDYGKKYYEQADIAPIQIKPVLLFYGMVQLVKACLLTTHSTYPENADVLAHGVSTRKRKKQDYIFFDDTITIQKKGLFSLLVKQLFGLEPMEGRKISMYQLLLEIPDLRGLFFRMKRKTICYPLIYNQTKATVTSEILDQLHMTKHRFEAFLLSHHIDGKLEQGQTQEEIDIQIHKWPNFLSHKPFLCDLEQNYYLSTYKEVYNALPELLVHYLLLYNLSMISRYETEWWNDLFHQKSSDDLPFITEFLTITSLKIPLYIKTYLLRKESEVK